MLEIHADVYLGEDDIARFKDNYGRARNSLKALILGLLLLHIVSAPAWATRVPSAVEFRAAYCFRIMQWSMRQRQSDESMLEEELQARHRGLLPKWRAGLSDQTMQEMLQRSQKDAANERAALEKLQRYLEPRLSSLEPEAVSAAKQRAEGDMQSIADLNGTCGFKCAHGPDFEACLAEKCGAEELIKRFAGCRNPSWLSN
jgi:hypothetical protein